MVGAAVGGGDVGSIEGTNGGVVGSGRTDPTPDSDGATVGVTVGISVGDLVRVGAAVEVGAFVGGMVSVGAIVGGTTGDAVVGDVVGVVVGDIVRVSSGSLSSVGGNVGPSVVGDAVGKRVSVVGEAVREGAEETLGASVPTIGERVGVPVGSRVGSGDGDRVALKSTLSLVGGSVGARDGGSGVAFGVGAYIPVWC